LPKKVQRHDFRPAMPSHPPLATDFQVPPTVPAQGSLVFLHGLGMDPAVLQPFVQSLALPVWTLLPSGPVDTGNGGRAWWPVDPARRQARLAAGPSDLFDRHPGGRQLARNLLTDALQRAQALAPGRPLVLAGFSQGGMLAVDHSLLGDHGATPMPTPSALVLLSSTCIALDEWAPRWHRLKGLPVLVAHGRDDLDLGLSAGERLRDGLQSAGAQVQWLPFEGGHHLPLVVWRALRRFVCDVVARPAPTSAKPRRAGAEA
jgi:phospholipase/carboxylesterase